MESATGGFDAWYKMYGDLLPDAFVFGVSGSAQAINIMRMFAKKVGDPNWIHYHNLGIFFTVGFEVLFSVSSAQIGMFGYGGAGLIKGETKMFPTSIYKEDLRKRFFKRP